MGPASEGHGCPHRAGGTRNGTEPRRRTSPGPGPHAPCSAFTDDPSTQGGRQAPRGAAPGTRPTTTGRARVKSPKEVQWPTGQVSPTCFKTVCDFYAWGYLLFYFVLFFCTLAQANTFPGNWTAHTNGSSPQSMVGSDHFSCLKTQGPGCQLFGPRSVAAAPQAPAMLRQTARTPD